MTEPTKPAELMVHVEDEFDLEMTPNPKPIERTVEVIAPSDLEGGYEFFVDAGNNTSYKVRVPANGVRSGERFQAIVISEASRGSHNIPFGRWRDGIFDCCNFGCCHPQFCLTFWCAACALGQVLTRMKLNWFGKSIIGEPSRSSSPFKIFFMLTIAYAIVHFALNIVIAAFQQPDGNGNYSRWGTPNDPNWLLAVQIFRSLLNYAAFFFIFFVTMKARGYIRGLYNIPERRRCTGCEDCCCSFWCVPCTICQMARHTADYRSYPAGCCTETGLNAGAPPVVVAANRFRSGAPDVV